MDFTLTSLISFVRDNLADIDNEVIGDLSLKFSIDSAYNYITMLCDTDSVDDDYLRITIIHLATYFAYINYTSVAENRMGTLPETASIRIETLRRNAMMFLNNISRYKLNDDLSIDTTGEDGGIFTFGITDSELENGL